MGRTQAPTTWQRGFSDVVLQRSGNGAAFYKADCKFCGQHFSGQPGRLISHLLQVKGAGIQVCNQSLAKTDPDLEDECQNLLDKLRSEQSATTSQKKTKASGASGSGASGSGSSAGALSGPLGNWLVPGSTPQNEQACDLLAAWIAQHGIAFNQVDNKAFDEFVAAAIRAGSAWRKPSRRTITRTITELAQRLRAQLSQLRGGSTSTTGYSITSDGWTDLMRRPIINVMRVTPSGVEFLEAVDCSQRDWRVEESEEDETPEKDAEFLTDTILAAIKRQSADPPVAIFMDNASVCIAAGRLLEADPYLQTTFFVPCASHCLDLLIEDIAKVPLFSEAIAMGKQVVNFMRNHQWALGKYRNVSKQIGGKNKALLKPGETRFATSCIMLQRLVEVKNDLESTVSSRVWLEKSRTREYKDTAREVKEIIEDDWFWSSAELYGKVTTPIIVILRMTDGLIPCLGKIYQRLAMYQTRLKAMRGQLKALHVVRLMDLEHRRRARATTETGFSSPSAGAKARHFNQREAVEEPTIDDYDSDEYDEEQAILDEDTFNTIFERLHFRWGKLHHPLHCAGFLTDPEFQNQPGLLQDKEIAAGWRTVLNKWCKTPEEKHLASLQLTEFRSKTQRFQVCPQNDAMYVGIHSTPAWLWWLTYGNAAPELQSIAIRVLAQVASSGASERNWSDFDYIYTKRRNRMKPSLVNDLVYLYSNMQVIQRRERNTNKRTYDDDLPLWEWIPEEDVAEAAEEDAEADAVYADEAAARRELPRRGKSWGRSPPHTKQRHLVSDSDD